MTWFYLALSAAYFWAVGMILVKKGFVNISPLWSTIFSNFISLFVWIPVALWLSNFQIKIPPFWVILAISFAAFTYMAFYYAISKGPLVLTGTLQSCAPVVTIMLSMVFLSERMAAAQILGVIFVILGGVVIATPKEGQLAGVWDLSWLKWGIIAVILIGSGDFFSKLSINQIGSYTQLIWLSIMSQVMSVSFYIFDKKGRNLIKITRSKILPTVLGTTGMLVGTLLYFLAFDYADASLVSPVATIYPGIMVVLAVTFLKEEINVKQVIGITGIIIGVVLVGFSPSG